MSTYLITLLRKAAIAFPLVLTAVGTAGAQPVTISGSGTLTVWNTFNAPLPAELEAAFPFGTPFTAVLTYDPRLVSGVEARGSDTTIYWDAVASISASVGSNSITNRSEFNPFSGKRVVVSDGAPVEPRRGDLLEGSDLALVDGAETFAGFRVYDTWVTLYHGPGTAISDTELPGDVCVAAWDEFWFTVTFLDPVFTSSQLYRFAGTGTPDRSIDSDRDGVSDGVERLHACVNPCAGDSDADGDLVLDRTEIEQLGTDPCSEDTDGDNLADGVDPNPLEAITASGLAAIARDTAADVLAIPEAAFEGANAAAERGRRNALANRLHAAANALQAGNLDEALSILEHVLELLDGNPVPPDVMEDGPSKDALRQDVESLIAIVRAALAQ